MALGSTQPLVIMSTKNISGGKGGRCVRLTTYHHTMPLSRNLGALTLLDPSGPEWPVTGVLYLYLYTHLINPCRERRKRERDREKQSQEAVAGVAFFIIILKRNQKSLVL